MVQTDVGIAIEQGLKKLEKIIIARLNSFMKGTSYTMPVLDAYYWSGTLLSILPVDSISLEEEIVLTLALVPHIRPHFIDQIIQDVYPQGGTFPQLGGIRGKNHRGFLPTGETALFLLSGEDLEKRFVMQQLFSSEHWFAQKQVLELASNDKEEPPLSGQ